MDKVNKVLTFIETNDITHTNELLLAAGRVVAKRLGVKPKQSRGSVAWWKKRLEGQVTQLRKDISRLERMKPGELNNTAIREELERRYSLNKKGLSVVLEELKQRVLAKSQKIRRYQDRTEQYKQNRMFQSNQKRLFEKIENMETDNTITPDADESKAFWGNIWDQWC